MPCQYDNTPINTEIIFGINSSFWCNNCNIENPIPYPTKGIYLGHFLMPAGKEARIQVVDRLACPHCNIAKEFLHLACDDDNIKELFTKSKIEENIEV